MNRNSSIFWFLIICFLILPSSIGKFFLDIAGGLILVISIISLIIAGIGWISWKKITSNIIICNNCGSSYFSNSNQCPICGSSNMKEEDNINNIPASSATIDVKAEKPN